MEWRLILVVLVAALYTPVHVTGVTLTIQPSTSLAEGKTLEVTCNQPTLGAGVALYSISLKSSDSVVLSYTYNIQQSEYEEKWENTMWRARSNITKLFSPSFNEGSFTLTVGQLQCSDSSSLKCEIVTSDVANSPQITAAQNVTVSGVTPYVQIADQNQQDCSLSIDPDCEYCRDFENPNSPTIPLYARRDGVLELTCSGDIANPLSMNRVRWYKRVVNQVEEGIIPVTNYTDLTPTSQSGNSQCRTNAYSTLKYYPQPEDRELRIFCEVSYIQDSERPVVTEVQSFCVQGLIKGPDVPGGSEGPGPNTAGLGGGAIAGIIIGVIAVIVLVVLLVYFLWYRRRDSGESYNTREADNRGAPPVAKKPEMHENSMYDTSGEPHDNNYYNSKNSSDHGKVNRGMEDDYYHHQDNDTTPRNIRDPIGSSV